MNRTALITWFLKTPPLWNIFCEVLGDDILKPSQDLALLIGAELAVGWLTSQSSFEDRGQVFWTVSDELRGDFVQ